MASPPAGTGLLYVASSVLDPTIASYGLGVSLSGSSGSRVLTIGQQRTTLDANHVHVYNCDEDPGSPALVDSGTGAKNATFSTADPYVGFLLHGNGSNGSTSFVDNSYSPKEIGRAHV